MENAPHSMTFTLRDYSTSDFETLYEIDQACYQRGIAYSRRMLRWYLSRRGSFCIVAEAPDEACATGTNIRGFIIAQAQGAEAYIITIDVLESHRRSGVGSALLQKTEAQLARMGVRYVGLQTATNNEAGVAFWRQHGYRSSGVTRGYYLGRIDAYDMFKDLHVTEGPATG
jgi:ribosomal-protein-alanine N-acetyltransferase